MPVLPDPPVFNAANLSSFIMNKSTHCRETALQMLHAHCDCDDDDNGDDGDYDADAEADDDGDGDGDHDAHDVRRR